MYIKNYDNISLLDWGINCEDFNEMECLENIELRFRDEIDLLCDMDFLFEDFI